MSPLSLADPSLLTLLLAPSANAGGRTSTDHGSQGVTLLVRFMGTRKIPGSLDLLLRPCAVGRAASRSATRVHGCWAYSCLPGAHEPTYSHCLAYLDPAVLPSLPSLHPSFSVSSTWPSCLLPLPARASVPPFLPSSLPPPPPLDDPPSIQG